eukprot:m.340268 g.340268  ORF g.340268 m.340268 type:complete len:58 (-) comp20591_c1_seq4:907-1080(-)
MLIENLSSLEKHCSLGMYEFQHASGASTASSIEFNPNGNGDRPLEHNQLSCVNNGPK